MLRLGYGITNLVERATAAADALSVEELIAGRQRLEEKVRHFRSRCVAVLGISAYRAAFRRPRAQLGRQSERLGGAMVWVLPNPSGLNAHYRPRDLADLFSALRLALGDGL